MKQSEALVSNFNESDKYRAEIHKLIPGGAHTYSKGDDQFPQLAPAAISHGKGAYVWDIDGNKYLDCSMGLSSVSLGHAYRPVLERVIDELHKGVNFQRPSYVEREMAKHFLSLVPGHDMIKFGKNGSLVTTAAVKLARAYTGRKLVAFPKNHPFYSYDDWFIGKTDCNLGVPSEVSALSVTFNAYDIGSLEELFQKYPGQIACVITEPERSDCYGDYTSQAEISNFLHQATELIHRNGAVYINDEMITGFKSAYPGSMTKFGITPDLSTWGKGIANGFSFCALTGKREIMQLGGIDRPGTEKLFLVSTTHGGETHAIAAGLATMKIFEEEHVVEHNQKLGALLIEKLMQIIDGNGLSEFMTVQHCNWLVGFIFRDAEQKISSAHRTLFMQEMIRRHVLFQGAFIPCFSHTESDIEMFCAAFEQSCYIYLDALRSGYEKFLVGEPAKPVFRKYI